MLASAGALHAARRREIAKCPAYRPVKGTRSIQAEVVGGEGRGGEGRVARGATARPNIGQSIGGVVSVIS